MRDTAAVKKNKTPWVDRNVSDFMGSLDLAVPNGAWLPSHGEEGVEELGCGHYGCAMPTDMSDVVFKITTDASEAMFARAAMRLASPPDGENWSTGDWPVGIVPYHAVYQLEGTTHYKRLVFAMWRRQVEDPGFVKDWSIGWKAPDHLSTYDQIVARKGTYLLTNIKRASDELWEYLGRKDSHREKVMELADWGYGEAGEVAQSLETDSSGQMRSQVMTLMSRLRGAEKAAAALGIYQHGAMMLEHNNEILTTVGHAMGYYLERGIVMGDLHADNIGLAAHEDYSKPVATIMDPGHAIFLDDRYDSLQIEGLERNP